MKIEWPTVEWPEALLTCSRLSEKSLSMKAGSVGLWAVSKDYGDLFREGDVVVKGDLSMRELERGANSGVIVKAILNDVLLVEAIAEQSDGEIGDVVTILGNSIEEEPE